MFERLRAMLWTIFDRTDMKISLCKVVSRVEFDGDVGLFPAPPKSMFLSISIEFFYVFCNFLVFQVFVNILICFFSVLPPSRNLCRRRRGSRRRRDGRRRRGGGRRVILFLHISV